MVDRSNKMIVQNFEGIKKSRKCGMSLVIDLILNFLFSSYKIAFFIFGCAHYFSASVERELQKPARAEPVKLCQTLKMPISKAIARAFFSLRPTVRDAP